MQTDAEKFAEFARSKPRDEGYCYFDVRGCAFYQFLVAAGYRVKSVGGTRWMDWDHQLHAIPDNIRPALRQEPLTFGALADRLSA